MRAGAQAAAAGDALQRRRRRVAISSSKRRPIGGPIGAPTLGALLPSLTWWSSHCVVSPSGPLYTVWSPMASLRLVQWVR